MSLETGEPISIERGNSSHAGTFLIAFERCTIHPEADANGLATAGSAE